MLKKILFLMIINLLSFSIFASEEMGEWDEVFDSLNLMVITASQTIEPVKESPVPVTVITKEMIEKMGAKTLRDVLITVPGFYQIQDHNELNISSRGIYASSQQKILILRDGHRLNTRSYQEANPDHHISLVGIERIEVLRGPGGSLYGDVALTGVVHLISTDAENIDGSKVSIGAGSYDQQQVNFLFGKEFDDTTSLKIYAHYYESDGEDKVLASSKDFNTTSNISSGIGIVDGISNKPSYDIGIDLNLFNTKFHVSKSYCHYVSTRTDAGTSGAIFNMADYRVFEGENMGLSTTTLHSYIEKNIRLFDDVDLKIKAYYDEGEIKANLVANPVSMLSLFIKWHDMNYGFNSYINIPYEKGNLLMGFQVEEFEVDDASSIFTSTKTGIGTLGNSKVLALGKENNYSVFAQLKHRFTEKMLLNTGLRYDVIKRAFGDDDPDEISPRIALIYLANEDLSIKLSYTRSFEEAPYWYRYNVLPAYQGASSLQPETMDSTQLTFDFKTGDSVTHQVNFFRNDLVDLVFRDTTITPAKYNNAGSVETQGLEYEVIYSIEALRIKFNYTYMDLVEATVFPSTDNEINNIPVHAANLIFDFNPIPALKDLWGHLYIRYIGERKSPIGNASTSGYNRNDLSNEEDAATIVNLKATWKNVFTEDLEISLLIQNLFDEEWVQGGSTQLPYEQASRWYFIELSYKFK